MSVLSERARYQRVRGAEKGNGAVLACYGRQVLGYTVTRPSEVPRTLDAAYDLLPKSKPDTARTLTDRTTYDLYVRPFRLPHYSVRVEGHDARLRHSPAPFHSPIVQHHQFRLTTEGTKTRSQNRSPRHICASSEQGVSIAGSGCRIKGRKRRFPA